MTDAQKKAYGDLYPLWTARPNEGSVFNFNAVFGNSNPVVIEIGFGNGDATILIAKAFPNINYLAIEVFKSGIGKLLWRIDKEGVPNIRIVEGDAKYIIENHVEEGSAGGFHIFFPDPWPKKKHHKRRLLRRPFTGLLSSRLSSGSYIYFVTDWEHYAFSALEELSLTPGLKNSFSGFAPPSSWRPQTKFEKKAFRENRGVKELFFRKL